MSGSLMLRRSTQGLLWKELRQIIPLMVASFFLTFFLFGLALMTPDSWGLSQKAHAIALGMPGFFAVGAGAVIVAQEREKRTIQWLGSLPISASRLSMMKLAVAILGLVAMGVCCIVVVIGTSFVTGVNPLVVGNLDEATTIDLMGWALHLLYVTIGGVFTAWVFRSAFVGLIALVPLGALPFAIVQLGYFIRQVVFGYRYVGPVSSGLVAIAVSLVSIACIFYLAFRIGVKKLGPAEPPSIRSATFDRVSSVATRSLDSRSIPDVPYRYSISSLIWQSINHNRLALAGVSGMILVGAVGFAVATHLTPWLEIELSGMVGFLGISWLGVFAFTGDGSPERLKFLAERGLSPTKVWLGRHLIGVGVLSTALLIYAAISIWLIGARDQGMMRNTQVWSIATVCLLAWMIYTVSQWSSQMFRLTAAVAVLAPCLSFAACAWLISVLFLSLPLWLTFLVCSLPLLVTWLSMRRHMDGRGSVMKWTLSTLGLLLLLGGPIAIRIGMLYRQYANDPILMSNSAAFARYNDLIPEATRIAETCEMPELITRQGSPVDDLSRHGFDNEPEEAADVESKLRLLGNVFDEAPAEILSEEIFDADGPIALESHTTIAIVNAACYAKLSYIQQPDSENADAFLQHVSLLTKLTQRLRESPNWRDQDTADVLEIWLTQTLSSQLFQPLRERSACRDAIEMLADKSSRNQSRHRALLASWQFMWKPGNRRFVGAPIHQLLDLVSAAENEQSTEPIRETLHHFTALRPIAFELGPYSDRLRVGSQDPFRLIDTDYYPANQWYAPWEDDAARLSDRDSTNQDGEQQ